MIKLLYCGLFEKFLIKKQQPTITTTSFLILIYLIINIFNNNVILINSQINKEQATVGLGCITYNVFPPSGTIIQNLNSFELMIEFNVESVLIKEPTQNNYFPINSYSEADFLFTIQNNQLINSPIFNLWDRSTNKTIVPIKATTKGNPNRIWLTFTNLPVTNNLFFQNDLGVLFLDKLSDFLAPRSIDIFSTNGVLPPKPEINSFLQSCPKSKKVEPVWDYSNPSNSQLFPITLKVEQCGTSNNIAVCKSPTQKYYYSLILPVSIAKGQVSTILNTITYQGYQYKFKDFPISVQMNQDITVKIPITLSRFYSSVYESLIVSSSSTAPYINSNNIDATIIDKYIAKYNSGYFDQVFMVLPSSPENKIIFPMNSTIDSNFLIKNYNCSFLFSSSTNSLVKQVEVGVFDPVIYQYVSDYIECPPNSIRNSFTVNQGHKNTVHKLNFFGRYAQWDLGLDNIKFVRDLDITFGSSQHIKVEMDNSDSNSQYKLTLDGLIGLSINFGISTDQFNSLSNSLLFSKDNEFINSSLMLPKSAVGTGMKKIGLDVDDWYSQVGFCNYPHGSNVNNQLQHKVQDGIYTLDVTIPNWVNVGGKVLNEYRTTIDKNKSQLIMKYNSNQATIKVQISSFEFLEPMIHEDNLTVLGIPGLGEGNECNGQFQFEIINFGEQSSMVNFDIDCIQDVYIEVLNYAQTIPDNNQKRAFYVNVDINKFYETPIQCQVSMWIDNKPLWSSVNKSFKKNITIPIFNGCNIPDPCLGINTEPVISKNYKPTVQYDNWVNLGNFLNSLSISIQINNIGNQTGDFISTLECITNIPGQNANYFMLNDVDYIITRNLGAGKTSTVNFLLYGESSPINGLQLSCSILSKVYQPNEKCWVNYNDENLVLFNLPYPYDKCVAITGSGNEPYIEFSLSDYSNGNIESQYYFAGSWSLSADSGPNTPIKHPLKIIPDSNNFNSIREKQIGPEHYYHGFFEAKVSNRGTVSAEFNVKLSNCSNELFVYGDADTSNVEYGQSSRFIFEIYSFATNVKEYSVNCDITVTTEIKECYSGIGKSLKQSPIFVFPPYVACAGNWLEPSLFKNLSYWDDINSGVNIELSEVNFKKGKWNFYSNSSLDTFGMNLYYQDLSIQVINKEYGYGNVKSTLVCNGIDLSTTFVLNDEKKSTCFLGANGYCFIGWRLISLPTTPDQELSDNIDCNLLIEIEDSEDTQSCWTPSGKSVRSSFSLTKLIDPCIPNTFNEVFITTNNTKQLLELHQSDWGLSGSSDYFNYNYFNNLNSDGLVYYTFKTIIIENTGSGIGSINSLVTINNPSVYLILNQSITKCEIQSNSYCTFTFLFGLIPIKYSSSGGSFFDDLEINIQFLVEPKLCWSNIDKTIQVIIVSELPTLPCGWDPSSPNNISNLYETPPQVSLIYPNEYIIGNLNYYQFTSNSLNLRFSKWYKLISYQNGNNNNNNDTINQNYYEDYYYYQTNLTGYVYNMGDGGGMVVFRLRCDNGNGTKKQFVEIENSEIVSYIPAGGYYNFNFVIKVLDKSPYTDSKSMVMCTVSSIVNLEKCWNPYGKSVIQITPLPFEVNSTDPIIFNNKSNDRVLLLSTLIPTGFILLLLLSFLIFKYYRFLINKYNQLKIENHQNKLVKPPVVIPTVAPTNNIEEVKEEVVSTIVPPVQCGCGANEPQYSCKKCPSSISNYCDPNCKNLVHSNTLDNLTHEHEPAIIICRDPRDMASWVPDFKFKENDKVVEDLILNQINEIFK